MASGKAFEDQDDPTVVLKIGEENSEGLVEITDMLFTTRGPSKFVIYTLLVYITECIYVAAGAIIVEWNVHDPPNRKGAAGLWDTHFRYALFLWSR